MTIWREWVGNVHGYNRNVRLFLCANVLFQIGMGMFMIMYNLYIRSLGYDQVVVGNVIAMTSLASAIILIPAGIISDKAGRKKVIFLGLLFTVFTLGLRSFIEGETGLTITAFMTGAFLAFIQVSAIPFLSENSTKEQRVHLFSFNFAIIMVANVIGNIAGGGLADLFQLVFGFSEVHSLRYTLVIGTGISLLGLIPMLWITEQRKKSRDNKSAALPLKKVFQVHKTSLKIIGMFAIAQILIGFGAGLVIPYLNVYFSDRFDASNTAIGIVLSLGQAATAVAMFIGPAIVRHVGEVKAVVFLQLSSIPFLLITGFTNNFYLASTGFLFRQALMNAGNPIQMSIMMGKVDDSMKGLANSVGQSVFVLGWAIMGPVSTKIVSTYGTYWGYAYVFCITALLYIVGSVYFYLAFAAPKQREQLAEQSNQTSLQK